MHNFCDISVCCCYGFITENRLLIKIMSLLLYTHIRSKKKEALCKKVDCAVCDSLLFFLFFCMRDELRVYDGFVEPILHRYILYMLALDVQKGIRKLGTIQ